MNYGKVCAIAMIILSIGASIGYFCAKDYRRAIYWACAAGITGSVTF